MHALFVDCNVRLLRGGFAAVALASIFLIACSGAVVVDAQAIVEESCANTQAAHSYDVTTTVSMSDPDQEATEGELHLQASGEDYSLVITFNDGSSGELRRVNGVTYFKEYDGPWIKDLPIEALGFPYAVESLCPELGPVARVGEETIDSIAVTHYTFSVDQNVGSVGNVDGSGASVSPVDEEWDVWLDSTGALVQTRQSVSVQLDGGEEATSELTSKISGIGEPNVITAPDIDGQ